MSIRIDKEKLKRALGVPTIEDKLNDIINNTRRMLWGEYRTLTRGRGEVIINPGEELILISSVGTAEDGIPIDVNPNYYSTPGYFIAFWVSGSHPWLRYSLYLDGFPFYVFHPAEILPYIYKTTASHILSGFFDDVLERYILMVHSVHGDFFANKCQLRAYNPTDTVQKIYTPEMWMLMRRVV